MIRYMPRTRPPLSRARIALVSVAMGIACGFAGGIVAAWIGMHI